MIRDSAARMVPKQKLDNIYVLLKCEISPLTIALPETGVFFVDNSAQKNDFWPFFVLFLKVSSLLSHFWVKLRALVQPNLQR